MSENKPTIIEDKPIITAGLEELLTDCVDGRLKDVPMEDAIGDLLSKINSIEDLSFAANFLDNAFREECDRALKPNVINVTDKVQIRDREDD